MLFSISCASCMPSGPVLGDVEIVDAAGLAVKRASTEKPDVVTTTVGSPAFSAAVAGRAAAGAQLLRRRCP